MKMTTLEQDVKKLKEENEELKKKDWIETNRISKKS